MQDRQTIVERIRDSADRHGPFNHQQLKQLLLVCRKSTDPELFFGLFSFFFDTSLQDNSFERQQLAGTILLKLSPACPLGLDGVVYAVPHYWDLSVEELPWYLCNIFGKEVVQHFLEELIPDVQNDQLQRSFKTMLFWANGYKSDVA